ncbi:MAG: hypothetical protein AB7T27_11925 [Kiritimatiellia bacterium]
MTKNTKRILGGALFFLALLACPGVFGQEPAAPAAEDDSAIRIRSAAIEGKVFLLTEEQGEEEIPGGEVDVKIRLRDDREILHHIQTRRDGSYELPKLEPGEYDLLVGELRLALEVVPETSERAGLKKVLIIMIPRDMSGRPRGRD